MGKVLLAWGPAAFWAAVLFFLSEAQPGPESPWVAIPDKVAHMGLYAVLGVTLAWGRWVGERPPAPLWLILSGLAYGLLDEWHQSFVPGRDPSPGDVLADGAGVILGFVILHLFLVTRHRAGGNPST